MKKVEKLTLVFLILLCAFSCAPKSLKKTDAQIVLKVGAAFSSTTRAILYAKGPNRSFAKKIDSGSISLPNLDNGSWNFYVVGYQNDNLRGTMKCEKQENINLEGGTFNLPMNISPAKCLTSPFIDPSIASSTDWDNSDLLGLIDPPKLRISNCKDSNKVFTDAAYAANDHTNDPNTSVTCAGKDMGAYTSFQVGLVLYDTLDGTVIEDQNYMSAGCFVVDSNGIDALYSLGTADHPKIPTGVAGLAPFKTVVKAYYASLNCGVSGIEHGFKEFNLESGMWGSEYAYQYASSFIDLVLDASSAEICSGNRLLSTNSQHSFAAGNGVVPYRICTVDQFQEIGGDNWGPIQADYNYAIEADLDFLTNLSQIGSSNQFASFQPIGSSHHNANGFDFSGSLYGNNYTLRNMYLFYEYDPACSSDCPLNDHGLIRSLSGSAEVRDLRILNAAIECNNSSVASNCSNVGIVAGRIAAASTVTIENIKVHGHVEAYKYLGGIAGTVGVDGGGGATSFNGEYLFANIYGSSDQGRAGGLFGYYDPSAVGSISKSSAHVQLHGHDSSTANYFGGLIGYMKSGTLDKVSSHGEISAERYLGGIAGQLFAGNINYAYSTMNIRSHYSAGDDHFLGGIVGHFQGSLDYTFQTLGLVSGQFNGAVGATVGQIVGQKAGGGNCGTTGKAIYTNAASDPCGGGDSATFNATTIKNMASFTSSGWTSGTGNIINNTRVGDAVYTILEGKNYPQLVYELEDNPHTGIPVIFEVPFLHRVCDLHHDLGGNYGGDIDVFGNEMICTTAQFEGMSSGTSYGLYNHLDFSDSGGFTDNVVGQGQYLLEGNSYTINNIDIEVSEQSSAKTGIFSKLNAGSWVKELILQNVKVENSTDEVASDLSGEKYIGLFAGENDGTISNVTCNEGELHLENMSIGDGSAGNDLFFIGGLVGKNGASGIIEKNDFHTGVSLHDTTMSGGGYLTVGGIAGKNLGDIRYMRNFGRVSYYSSGGSTDTTNEMTFATLVGENNGSIYEVEVEGEIEINNDSGGGVGKFSGFVGINQTSGELFNSISNSRIQMTNLNGIAVVAALVADQLNADPLKIDNLIYFRDETPAATVSGAVTVKAISGIQGTDIICGGSNANTICTESNELGLTNSPFVFSNTAGELGCSDNIGTCSFSSWPVINDNFFNPDSAIWIFESSDDHPYLNKSDDGLDSINPGFE